jgi:hypothetical protein
LKVFQPLIKSQPGQQARKGFRVKTEKAEKMDATAQPEVLVVKDNRAQLDKLAHAEKLDAPDNRELWGQPDWSGQKGNKAHRGQQARKAQSARKAHAEIWGRKEDREFVALTEK